MVLQNTLEGGTFEGTLYTNLRNSQEIQRVKHKNFDTTLDGYVYTAR
jgi:hypothetical protein